MNGTAEKLYAAQKMWTYRRAKICRLPKSLSELRVMCSNKDSTTRLMALFTMRNQIEAGGVLRGYFALAKRLLADRNENCRWQAAIVIGEFIDECPEDVWRVVERYGRSEDGDIRAAVATVLLEHLLEHHSKTYRLRARALAKRCSLFAKTFGMCWSFQPPKGGRLAGLRP